MLTEKRKLGNWAEAYVLRCYEAVGYTLIKSQKSFFKGKQCGEIDLILQRRLLTVLCEVKFRRTIIADQSWDYIWPPRQRDRIHWLARMYQTGIHSVRIDYAIVLPLQFWEKAQEIFEIPHKLKLLQNKNFLKVVTVPSRCMVQLDSEPFFAIIITDTVV